MAGVVETHDSNATEIVSPEDPSFDGEQVSSKTAIVDSEPISEELMASISSA